MKTWFGALGRFCADFLLTLVLLGAVSLLAHSPVPGTWGWVNAPLLASLKDYYPLAMAVALTFGYYSFEGRLGQRRRLAAWVSVVVMGFAVLVGMSYLRRILPEVPPQATNEGPARSGVIIDLPSGGLYARSVEGSELRGVVTFTAGGTGPHLLAFSEGVTVGSSPLSEAPRREGLPLPALTDAGALLSARLAVLDALPLPWLLVVLAGFVLLGVGLGGFSRLPRWPLLGFFLAAAAALSLLALDELLSGSDLRRLAEPLIARLGQPEIPWPAWVAMAEGLLGLLMAAVTLPPWSRREE